MPIQDRIKEPYLDRGLKGWIVQTALKEHWRCAAWYELADLIQDGYVCYCKCRNKYTLGPPEPGHPSLNTDQPTKVQRKHFMSLVQRAFYNHIMTLSSEFASLTEDNFSSLVSSDSLISEEVQLERVLPAQPEEISVLTALSNAPAEVCTALEKLVRDGLDGTEYVRSRLYREGDRVRLGRRKLRETTDQLWQRLVGDANFPQKLTAYLRS